MHTLSHTVEVDGHTLASVLPYLHQDEQDCSAIIIDHGTNHAVKLDEQEVFSTFIFCSALIVVFRWMTLWMQVMV